MYLITVFISENLTFPMGYHINPNPKHYNFSLPKKNNLEFY